MYSNTPMDQLKLVDSVLVQQEATNASHPHTQEINLDAKLSMKIWASIRTSFNLSVILLNRPPQRMKQTQQKDVVRW